jgi:hypothetical protein
MIAIGVHIEIEPSLKQFIPFVDITGGAEQVLEPYRTVTDFGKG